MGAVLLLVVLAAAPAPRVAASAEMYLFAPKLDRLDGVRAFTALAGQKTAMMKPYIWSEEVLPLLAVDITSPESLSAAGVDPAGSLTTSFTSGGIVSCVNLSSPEEFVNRARRSYAMSGARWTGTIPNASFGAVAAQGGSVSAGYLQRGSVGCVVKSSKGRGGNLMLEAEKLLGTPKTPTSWKSASVLSGVLYVATPDVVAAVRAAGTTLTVDARGVKLPLTTPTLAAAGPSPFANIPNSGVFTLKARLEPAALVPFARSFAMQLTSFCAGCNDKALSDAILAVTSELTGNVYLRVDSLAISAASLRTDEGRYFSLRHAYVAELKNPAAVKALVEKMPAVKGAQRTDAGLSLQAGMGVVDLRVVGNNLIISNDTAALSAATALLSQAKPGTLAHSLQAQGDPEPLGKALRKLSLLDAMSSSQLAGLFAAGVEFGPLLAASEKATLWADSGVPMKAQAVWVLDPPKAVPQTSPDAGSPPRTP